jgi:hypothetical protein
MRVIHLLTLAAILALPTLRASADEIRYQIQPIVRVGGTAGDVLIPPDLNLLVGRLNDNGQILFVPRDVTAEKPTWMIQYSGGDFITIGVPGKEAPIGQWPEGVAFNNLLGMNQSGNVAFVVHRYGDPAGASLGSFLWDYQKRQVTPVIRKGMPAVNDLPFENGGSLWTALNNLGDIALGQVRSCFPLTPRPATVVGRGSLATNPGSPSLTPATASRRSGPRER